MSQKGVEQTGRREEARPTTERDEEDASLASLWMVLLGTEVSRVLSARELSRALGTLRVSGPTTSSLARGRGVSACSRSPPHSSDPPAYHALSASCTIIHHPATNPPLPRPFLPLLFGPHLAHHRPTPRILAALPDTRKLVRTAVQRTISHQRFPPIPSRADRARPSRAQGAPSSPSPPLLPSSHSSH